MSRSLPKAPLSPKAPLRLGPDDVVVWSAPLWRIHAIAGPHPAAWNELRAFGPVAECRWDPHPEPRQLHTAAGSPFRGVAPAVAYTAADPDTAFVEVSQNGIITLSPDRALTAWEPRRSLELLDLAGSDFLMRNGATDTLLSAPRSTCRAWARAIWEQHGGSISGLLTRSTWTGDPVVVLFPMAATHFPAAPAFTRSLDHPDVATLARRAGRRFGWPVHL